MTWSDRWILKSDMNRKLIEGGMILLMIIITLVIVIMLYRYSSGAANRTVCAGHLRQISQALTMYAQDNDDQYPLEGNWSIALVNYLDSLEYLTCPSDIGIRPIKKKKGEISTVSYFYNDPKAKSDDASTIVTCGDRVYPNFTGNHTDGGNIAFLDGHISWKTTEQWEKESLPVIPYTVKNTN